MGILKSREELIPVTCAILDDSERKDFFSRLRRRGATADRIARACGTSKSVAAEWMNGQTLIPYQSLQRLSQEFATDAPPVRELRREFQTVSSSPAPRPAPAEPAPPPPERKKPGARKGRAKPPEPKPRRKAAGPARKPSKPAEPAGAKPRYSDRLAYWTGALYAGGNCSDGALRFTADRRMGQNFASTWARLTDALFGVKPALSMSEDRRSQVAALSGEDAASVLDRCEPRPGPQGGAAPRWVWSNPEWKSSFLKGVVDASCHFHRSPSLNLIGLSGDLGKSAFKMLSTMGFSPKVKPDGTLAVEGAADAEKYIDSIGTDNLKLRDQFAAYRKARSERPAQAS
jgi:transcriptional regulator with XRE-family HTH domain